MLCASSVSHYLSVNAKIDCHLTDYTVFGVYHMVNITEQQPQQQQKIAENEKFSLQIMLFVFFHKISTFIWSIKASKFQIDKSVYVLFIHSA